MGRRFVRWIFFDSVIHAHGHFVEGKKNNLVEAIRYCPRVFFGSVIYS